MHVLYRLFRINRLSTIQLNRVLVWCMLVPTIIGFGYFSLSMYFLLDSGELVINGYTIIAFLYVLYYFVRIWFFSRRHWWSWIVLTFNFFSGLIVQLISFALVLQYMLNPGDRAILLESFGYIGLGLFLLILIIGLLLNLYIVLGLTSRRISGHHGIGKTAFTITLALGGGLAMVVALMLSF
jgi:hypothetical protein